MARPPMREGVSASMVVVQHGPWPSVLAFLQTRFADVPAADWSQRLAQGLVLDARGQALQADSPCTSGELLHYYREVPQEPPLPELETVLFEDEHLLVADKPHFMPVTPSGRHLHNSLLVRLKQQTACADLTPLHRLDRETAGLVVFGKRPSERAAYHALFRDRQVHKTYEAVADFKPDLPLPTVRRSRLASDAQFFRSREVPGEANSETRVSLIQALSRGAHYLLEPLSGQRHQLRIHMMVLGLPIWGDQFYPEVRRGSEEPDDFSQALQLLARRIAFTDPITGAARVWTSARVLDAAS